MDDLEALAAELRRRGMSLCIDLVMNHTAREHVWARTARAGDPTCRGLLPRLPRPRAPGRLRADAARGLPRVRAGELHVAGRHRALGLDDLPRVPVGPGLRQPRGLRRHVRHHVSTGQPGNRDPAPRRRSVHLEATRHRLREPARGARPAGGVPRPPGGGGAGRGAEGRGDRAARATGPVPRRRRPRARRVRAGVPQPADGHALEQPGHGRGRADEQRAGPDGGDPGSCRVGHVRPLPRRHRVGGDRRGCRVRRVGWRRAPRLPQRVLPGSVPVLLRPGVALPAQRGDGRRPHLRVGGVAVRHRERPRTRRSDRARPRRRPLGAAVRGGVLLRRRPARVHGRRDRAAQRPLVPRRSGTGRRQPLVAPAVDGLGLRGPTVGGGDHRGPGVPCGAAAGRRSCRAAPAPRRREDDGAPVVRSGAPLLPAQASPRAAVLDGGQLLRARDRRAPFGAAGVAGAPAPAGVGWERRVLLDGAGVLLPAYGYVWLTV